MLNYLWAGMMALGILWGAFHGNLAQVTNGALDSAREAVTLCLTMLGIMSFWCGILKVGEEAGLIEALTKKMRPVIRLLFPDMPEDHPAAAHRDRRPARPSPPASWRAPAASGRRYPVRRCAAAGR